MVNKYHYLSSLLQTFDFECLHYFFLLEKYCMLPSLMNMKSLFFSLYDV